MCPCVQVTPFVKKLTLGFKLPVRADNDGVVDFLLDSVYETTHILTTMCFSFVWHTDYQW
jgi:hypothetical protein